MYIQKIHVSCREFRVKKSRPTLCRGDDGHENYRPPTRRRTTPPDGGVPRRRSSFITVWIRECVYLYIYNAILVVFSPIFFVSFHHERPPRLLSTACERSDRCCCRRRRNPDRRIPTASTWMRENETRPNAFILSHYSYNNNNNIIIIIIIAVVIRRWCTTSGVRCTRYVQVQGRESEKDNVSKNEERRKNKSSPL